MILFCTPCYGGMVTAPHFKSCLELRAELHRAGVPHDWLIGWNESLVHRGRMEMTASFLASGHTHLFWLDADIDFTPEDVAAVWNLDADIAVGVYAMKKRDEQWYATWKGGALVKDLDQFAGPVEVDFAGTGFMHQAPRDRDHRAPCRELRRPERRGAGAVHDPDRRPLPAQRGLLLLRDRAPSRVQDHDGAAGPAWALGALQIWRLRT